MRNKPLGMTAVLSVAMLFAGLTAAVTTAAADTVSKAAAAAYGVNLAGPVPLENLPAVEASTPGGETHSEDSVVEIPADPLATSFTVHVEADAARRSSLDATLQPTMDAAAEGLPAKWNARAYAITEDLSAVTNQIHADVIESEAVAACDGGAVTFSSAARILNLAVAGQQIPVLNPRPNQVLFNQLGISIIAWETNWDPASGTLADGSDTVFANALHITAPGGIDLIVSHSESTAKCARDKGNAPKKPLAECEDGKDNDGDGKIDFPSDPGCLSLKDDDERDTAARPASPIQSQPSFTG